MSSRLPPGPLAVRDNAPIVQNISACFLSRQKPHHHFLADELHGSIVHRALQVDGCVPVHPTDQAKERKQEGSMKVHQKFPGKSLQEGSCGFFHIGKHTQPQGFLAQEQLLPFIEDRRRDTGRFTKDSDRFPVQEITLQNSQDKPEEIRAVRNKAAGEGGVGMTPYHKSDGCPVYSGQRLGEGEGHFGRCGFSFFLAAKNHLTRKNQRKKRAVFRGTLS